MMSALVKLDQRIKQHIKQLLESFLYQITQAKHDKKLMALIEQNTVAYAYPHHSFSYKGRYYSFEQQHPRFKTQRLMEDLWPAMDELLKEQHQLEYTEKAYITGLFNRVLNATESIDDMLELLPDCLHPAIKEYCQELRDKGWALPRQLSEEQVLQFRYNNAGWISLVKQRMVLDIIT